MKSVQIYGSKFLDFKVINAEGWSFLILKILVKSSINKVENSLKDTTVSFNENNAPLENSKYFIENYKYLTTLVNEIFIQIEKIILVVNLINNELGEDLKKNKIKKLIFNIIEIATIEKIFSEKKLNSGVKTIKLKKLNFEGGYKNSYIELEYYEHPFKIIYYNTNILLINSYLFSVKFGIKDNKYNKKNIKIIDINFLQNALLTPFFIEIDLLLEVKNEILKTTNFKDWNYILSGDAYESIKKENSLDINIKKSFLENKEKYDNIKKNYTDEHKHIYFDYKKAEKAYKNIQKSCNQQYAILITLNIFYRFFEELKNRENPFYLSNYIDFRGRIYSDSKIGPTSSRIYRHLYCYGYYSEVELAFNKDKLNDSRAFNLIYENKKILYKFEKDFNVKLTTVTANIILWFLLELGKINKNKLSKVGKITMIEFLESGYSIFINKEVPKDLEDKIVYLKIIKAVANIIDNKKIKKTIIYKDSTASVLQHLTKLLGHKSEKILEIMNINATNTWKDPYFFIIDLYLIRYPVNDLNVKNLFTRKNLKKLIMTINYSLTYRSAIDYFFQESNKELKDILLNFNEEETTKFIKKLKDEIKNFYQFLKFDVEREELFEKSSNELISTWHEGKELKTCDNATINLNYKKLIKKSIEVKIGNTRLSMVEHVATSEFDKRKTNIALRANIVHSMDSFFVRAILNDKSMITIHDSFGIDIASTPLLIDKANKIFTNDVFKEKILIHNKSLKKTYSIFLLL